MSIPTREQMLAAAVSRHGEANQRAISSASVAICGLGGIGSNVAVALARAGVGRLVLADFDRVDVTNLQRQQYKATQTGMLKTQALKENLLEIAPYIQIVTYNIRLTDDNVRTVIADSQIVCEAFDDAQCKAMLAEAVLAGYTDKYLVACSGMAGFGSPNAIKTRRISGRFYLCGDGISEVGEGLGLVSSRVMLCAAHQAHTILRIITGQTDV